MSNLYCLYTLTRACCLRDELGENGRVLVPTEKKRCLQTFPSYPLSCCIYRVKAPLATHRWANACACCLHLCVSEGAFADGGGLLANLPIFDPRVLLREEYSCAALLATISVVSLP